MNSAKNTAIQSVSGVDILKPHALNKPHKPEALSKPEPLPVMQDSVSRIPVALEGGFELRLHKSEPYAYDPSRAEDVSENFDDSEPICLSCEQRRYVDGSNDGTVSFQTPTKIDAKDSASAVMAHEQQHVRSDQAQARADGKKVVNQSVTLHRGCCPECGESYVKGGTTRTVTVDEADAAVGAYRQMKQEQKPQQQPQRFESTG